MKNSHKTEISEDPLAQKMARLGVRSEDIEEIFTRAGAAGGQNVNKVSSAVIVIHVPTGLRVRCEDERSQSQNRIRARWMLLNKLEERRQERIAEEKARIEKIRRQKRPRSRAAKERILASKAHQSAKKQQRRVNKFE